MSYYKHMVSVYRSNFPVLNRRSTSVERTYSSDSRSYDSAYSRFNRASTAPPSLLDSDSAYYGVMPFNRSLRDIEDRIRLRASSVQPVSTYSRAYRSTTPYGASTSYDYKVMDYANRLDREETTRDYINHLRSDYYSRATTTPHRYQYTSSFDNPYGTWGSSGGSLGATYGSSAAYADRLAHRTTNLDSYKLNRDLYSYKHYRKSTQTLEDRNTRAKSPILSRELDRYYRTEKRSSYLGDQSSGGQNDFRYYNYRHVPYYGGSDYYAYVPRLLKYWNNEHYPTYLPTYPVTIRLSIKKPCNV